MNIHLPQSYTAISEAKYLNFTDLNYTVPTSGKPIRGLIQDHIIGAVLLCKKDTFLTSAEFMQLVNCAELDECIIPHPCILIPVKRWSGKQVISTILRGIAGHRPGINTVSRTKLGEDVWSKTHAMEGYMTLRDNYMLTGVLDKAHIGAADFGLFHLYHETYGPAACSSLITALARVLTMYIQIHGFTCGLKDLVLNKRSD